MKTLTELDYELIKEAQSIIMKNYDDISYLHTVGAALRCKSGRIYVGVNVYSIHGSCAEQVALGSAITAGERDFECIVSVRGAKGEEILPPCGNCRQILTDYAPACEVIVEVDNTLGKLCANELLPCAYKTEN